MMEMTLKKVADAVGGHVKAKFQRVRISEVCTDSRRDDLTGCLFVAIAGKNWDGHDFIREAIYKGAACVLSEKKLNTSHPVITVKSTRSALLDLARYYRSQFNIHVVAVTGSVGKTTTKDMIAQVLSTRYKTLKTEGNFNNDIGLPLTIFKLDDTYQAAVFEMGMNHYGEIQKLAQAAQPTVAVITNIGDNHMENLGNREGILAAKCEMLEFLSESGQIILNGDDPLLRTITGVKQPIHYFGLNPDNDYYALNIKNNGLIGVSCQIRGGGAQFKVNIPIPGEHMVLNALAAAAVGDVLGLGASGVKNGLESVRSARMRMDIINSPRDITIINDVYNASPISMMASLDVLAGVGPRRVCILGDMFELGEQSGDFHYKVGEYAAGKGIELIICVGPQSANTHEGAVKNAASGTECLHFYDQEALIGDIHKLLRDGDTVLIKASRGMHLERTVNELLQIGEDNGQFA